jgi:hypothetical protein
MQKMQKTKEPYDVVLRLGKKTFLIFKNIYVLYDPESTWWVDDRIRRIDQRVYAGDLIQNRDGMVLKHTAAEDIERVITDYFGVDPDIVAYAAVNPKLNQNYDNEGRELSTYKMRERYELTQKSWKHGVGNIIDTKIIYQGDNIPIKLPGVSEVEIYDKDYGIFGIHNYENWIPDPTRYTVGEIYHISGEFVADTGFDKYTKMNEVKVFTPTTPMDPTLPEKILVTKKGFVDDKTFNCIGSEPVELDIFFRFDQLDTDSWYMTVLLITTPIDSYLKKKYPHIPGNLEGAYNSSAKISEATIPKRWRWRPENRSTQKKTYAAAMFNHNSDSNILSDEEKSLIESVLDIVINLHNHDDYEQVLLSIQETINNKLDKHLVEDAVVISESAAGVKTSQPINDVDAVLPPIMTGLEGKGYNKNLKLIHDAANYWGKKAKEERKEELFGGENDGNET